MKILVKKVKYGNSREIAAKFEGSDIDLFSKSVDEDWNSHWEWIVYNSVDEVIQGDTHRAVVFLFDCSVVENMSERSYAKVEALKKSKQKHPAMYAQIIERIEVETAWLQNYEPELSE